jgi:Ran GTPase-activating protein (RanGAP) involved in mRNA processing and transport
MERTPQGATLGIENRRGKKGDEELAQKLEEVNEQHNVIFVRSIYFSPVLCASLSQAMRGRHWKKVEMRQVRGDVTTAMAACMSLNDIEEFYLTLYDDTEVQYKAWVALGMAMQQKHSQLKILRLHINCSARQMEKLAEGLKSELASLQVLDLNWSTIADEAIRELAAGLQKNKSLHHVKFYECRLGDQQVAQLVDSVAHHPKLNLLDFTGNRAGPLTSASLSNLLRSSQTIETLDFSYLLCGDCVERLQIDLIASALGNNSSLRILDLTNRAIADEDAERLCRVLCESNRTLVELRLGMNKITDQGIQVLANMMPQMSASLERLSLWGNPFTDKGVKVLAEGLAKNFTLVELDLTIHYRLTEEIPYYCGVNRAGRRLWYSTASVPLGLWPLILERLRYIVMPNGCQTTTRDLMMYMLRSPALLHSISRHALNTSTSSVTAQVEGDKATMVDHI